jgi:hypothetical protein
LELILNKKKYFSTIVVKNHKKLVFCIFLLFRLAPELSHAVKNHQYPFIVSRRVTDCSLFPLGDSNGGDERRHPEHNAFVYGRGAFGASRSFIVGGSNTDGASPAQKLGSMAMD